MSHHNTLFSQMLSLIPRHVFQKLEHRHKVGRASRKFGFKEQFTAMAFIQLAARRSMRDGLPVSGCRRKPPVPLGPEKRAPLDFRRRQQFKARGLFQGLVR